MTARRAHWLASLLCVCACVFTPDRVAAQVAESPAACGTIPEDTPRLEWEYLPPESGTAHLLCAAEAVADILSDARGSWGIALRDFSTGESLLVNPGKRFVAGSLYKLGVAAEAYSRVSEGTLTDQSYVAIGAQDVDPEYGGSRYAPGTYLTLRDAVDAMLTQSDNGAALATVDRLGLYAVNRRFVELGMPDTRLVYDAETTPRDLLTYFALLAEGELISPDVSDTLLNVLAAQSINFLIPSGLPGDESWWMAHKTGNVDAMLGDAGIVFTPNGAFAVVVINNDLVSYAASIQTFRAIARCAYRSIVPALVSS